MKPAQNLPGLCEIWIMFKCCCFLQLIFLIKISIPYSHFLYCCYCSVAKSCLTLHNPVNSSMSGSSLQPLSPRVCSNSCPLTQWYYLTLYCLLPYSPPVIILSQHHGLFRLGSSHQVAKTSFSISPSDEYSGLIFFRSDWLDLLAVFSKHNSKASFVPRLAFFTDQLSHPYMTTGETIALTLQNFVGKVMSLLFNILPNL